MAQSKHIAGSSNGRTAPSGGVYLGSSPSPAAFFYSFLYFASLLKLGLLRLAYADKNTLVDKGIFFIY